MSDSWPDWLYAITKPRRPAYRGSTSSFTYSGVEIELPPGELIFPHLAEPQRSPYQGNEDKFSASVKWDSTFDSHSVLWKLLDACKIASPEDNFSLPIHGKDERTPDGWRTSASSHTQPLLYYRWSEPAHPSLFQPEDRVSLIVEPFVYRATYSGSRHKQGLGLALRAVRLWSPQDVYPRPVPQVI